MFYVLIVWHMGATWMGLKAVSSLRTLQNDVWQVAVVVAKGELS